MTYDVTYICRCISDSEHDTHDNTNTHIYLLTGPQELVSPTSVGQHQEPAGAAGVVRQ